MQTRPQDQPKCFLLANSVQPFLYGAFKNSQPNEARQLRDSQSDSTSKGTVRPLIRQNRFRSMFNRVAAGKRTETASIATNVIL